MTDDAQLLARYVKEGSEPAFGELVARYINLVYSTAVRQVSDAHLAQDIVQTVFTALARKAPVLPRDVILGGWLYRHTCFVSSQARRTELRRQARERQAVAMNELSNEPEHSWDQLAPFLDEAMEHLGTGDRDALVLRYFEKRDFRDVGVALGVSEEAARKKVTRAVDKLRLAFVRRGLTLSGTALGAVLTAHTLTAAPAGLAVTVTTTAVAGAAATSGLTLSVLKLMAISKLKVAAGAILAAGVGTVLVLEHQEQTRLREQNFALQQQIGQLASLQDENRELSNLLAQAKNNRIPNDQLSELLRLRGEVGALRNQTNELAKLRSENQRSRSSAAAGQNQRPADDPQPEYYPKESWTYAGFADPRSAFQSTIWARTVGNADVILASWAPEERAREEAQMAREGKTFADNVANAVKEMEQVKSFRILRHEAVSDDEVILTVAPEGIDGDQPAPARMVRVGNEWKFAGFGKRRPPEQSQSQN